MARTPETSTSRSALDVAGAALDLCDEATVGGLSEEVRLDRIGAVLNAGRDLRPYQVEEVLLFVAERLGLDAHPVVRDLAPSDSSTTPAGTPVADRPQA